MATSRAHVILACNQCKRRNYVTSKNKQTHPDRLERRHYCRWCRSHVDHKETR